MKTIGFATQFYTLWDVEKHPLYSTLVTASGEQRFQSGTRIIYTFYKNISKNLEKVKELYPNTPIDENLRGMTKTFERNEGYSNKVEYGVDVISIGRNRGKAINDINDLRDLKWSYYNENNSDRSSLLLKRIEEFGEILFEGSFVTLDKKNEILTSREKINDVYQQATENEIALVFNFDRNLNRYGAVVIDDVRISFPEFKVMSYNGYTYSLPTIKGVGKKLKGKQVEVVVETGVHSFYGENSDELYEEKSLIVKSFKIL